LRPPPLSSAPSCLHRPGGGRRAPRSFPTRRSSDLEADALGELLEAVGTLPEGVEVRSAARVVLTAHLSSPSGEFQLPGVLDTGADRKSTRLNSSHVKSSYAVFCLKKKNAHRHVQHD